MAQKVGGICERRRTAFRARDRQGLDRYCGRKIRRARNESAGRPGGEDRRSRCGDRRFDANGPKGGRQTKRQTAAEETSCTGKNGRTCSRGRRPRSISCTCG